MGEPSQQRCLVCGRSFPQGELAPVAVIRAPIAALIRAEAKDWDEGGFVCTTDLDRFRYEYVESMLRSEAGEISDIEKDVLHSLHQHETIAEDIESQWGERATAGQRLADLMATFGGSWWFIGLFSAVLATWIAFNALGGRESFDPYPFILLNLVLSCLAAIQAPVIMMSQNRQEAKDRARSQHDYRVNLKAELEIRQLHEKVDHLLRHQWERLVEIQQIQIDLLEELRQRKEPA
jgi:uncharacterized membrane protein